MKDLIWWIGIPLCLALAALGSYEIAQWFCDNYQLARGIIYLYACREIFKAMMKYHRDNP